MFDLPSAARRIDRVDTTAIEAALLNDEGRLKVVPAATLASFSEMERLNFCYLFGVYTLPTVELIDFLKSKIDNLDKCIEIGAGNGVYSRTLGIIGTDNLMQHPKNKAKFSGVQSYYNAFGQPVVNYGENVIEIDGQEAVRKYKAETVICSWVTHKYCRTKPELGGNMYGVDFNWILQRKHTRRVILIGNKGTHANNEAMKQAHEEHELNGILFSRAARPDLDRVFIWDC